MTWPRSHLKLQIQTWPCGLCPHMFTPERFNCNTTPSHRNRVGGDFLETAGTDTKNKRHLSSKWSCTAIVLLLFVCFSGWCFHVIFFSSGCTGEAINILRLYKCYCGNESLLCPLTCGCAPRCVPGIGAHEWNFLPGLLQEASSSGLEKSEQQFDILRLILPIWHKRRRCVKTGDVCSNSGL